ncbi:MAG: MFS transporter [Carboxydocellales bacterium]
MKKGVLALLSMGHLVTDLSQGMLPFLIPFLQAKFQLSYFLVGIIVLVSNLSSSFIQPIFGYISDKVSMRWIIPVGCLVANGGMALAGVSPNYSILLLAVFIGGLGVAGFHPEASKVAHYVGGPKKATGMSIFAVGGNLGMGFGPILGAVLLGIAGLKGMLGMLVVGAVMAFFLLKVTKLDIHSPQSMGQDKTTTGQESGYLGIAWKAVMLLIGVVTIRSWTQAGITTFMPLFLVNYAQKSHEYSSTMLAVFLISGGLGTLIGGPAADRWGRKTVIMVSMLLTPLSFLLWLKLPGFWSPLFLALAGAVIVATFSVTVVFCQELLPRNIGMASGLMMGFAIGMGGVGATILGLLSDRWGLLNTLYLITALPIAGLVLATFLPGQTITTHKEAG